tara:strand:+ start:342 stop:746 length:405 start_codon:yes stop_codon:yes gene_type:complete
MYLRLSILLTAIINLLIPLKIFALESCGSAIKSSGIKINGDAFISTQKIKVDSELKEDFIKSLYEAESLARIKLLRFINMRVINGREIHPDKISDPPSLEKQLNMMVTTSKCHIRKKYVQVSVELSPRTINLAK